MVGRAALVWLVLLAVASPRLDGQQQRQALPEIRFSEHFDAKTVWSDFEQLASPELEGRRTGSAGSARARELIVTRFKEAGLLPFGDTLLAPFRFTRNGAATDGVNVVGLCKAPTPSDQRVMVITAHYDHVGVPNGVVYPGADDNASGVVAMLAIASQCKRSPWRHDALFVAFDAEEMGLQGARAFVSAPPVAKERIALNINMDMVSRSDRRELYVAGAHHRPAIKPLLEGVAARAPITLTFGHDKTGAGGARDDWTMQSDHGAFHTAGIPFVYFGVEDHPDYHKATDTLDKVDAPFFFDVIATIFEAVGVLDRALPSLGP